MNWTRFCCVLSIVSFILVSGTSAQGGCSQSNAGRSFIVAFMQTPPSPTKTLTLTVGSTSNPISVTVTYSNSASLMLYAEAYKHTAIRIPVELELSGNGGIVSRAIQLTTNDTATVVGLSEQSNYSEAYLALPSSALGKRYFVVSYALQAGDFGDIYRAQFAVVAAQDNTVVTVTLSGMFTGVLSYLSVDYRAGQQFNFILNRLDTIQFQSTADLTGTEVTGSNQIAVWAGNLVARIDGQMENNVVEQMLPVEASGTSFAVGTLPAIRPYAVKIVAVNPGTTVSFVNQSSSVEIPSYGSQTLARSGDYMTSYGAYLGLVVNASSSIIVCQLTSSSFDSPAMTVVPPISGFLAQYRFVIPTNTSRSLNVFTTILVNSIYQNQMRYDNSFNLETVSWRKVPGANYSETQIPTSRNYDSVHQIDGPTQNATFSVSVNGLYSDQPYIWFLYPAGFCLGSLSVPYIETTQPTSIASSQMVLTATGLRTTSTRSAVLRTSETTISSSSLSLSSLPVSSVTTVEPFKRRGTSLRNSTTTSSATSAARFTPAIRSTTPTALPVTSATTVATWKSESLTSQISKINSPLLLIPGESSAYSSTSSPTSGIFRRSTPFSTTSFLSAGISESSNPFSTEVTPVGIAMRTTPLVSTLPFPSSGSSVRQLRTTPPVSQSTSSISRRRSTPPFSSALPTFFIPGLSTTLGITAGPPMSSSTTFPPASTLPTSGQTVISSATVLPSTSLSTPGPLLSPSTNLPTILPTSGNTVISSASDFPSTSRQPSTLFSTTGFSGSAISRALPPSLPTSGVLPPATSMFLPTVPLSSAFLPPSSSSGLPETLSATFIPIGSSTVTGLSTTTSLTPGPPISLFSTPGPPVSSSSTPGPPVSPSSTTGLPVSLSVTPGPPVSSSSTPGPPVSPSSTTGLPVSLSVTPGPPVSSSSTPGPPVSPSSTTGLPVSLSVTPGPPVSSSSTSGPPVSPSSTPGPPAPSSATSGLPASSSSATTSGPTIGIPTVGNNYSVSIPRRDPGTEVVIQLINPGSDAVNVTIRVSGTDYFLEVPGRSDKSWTVPRSSNSVLDAETAIITSSGPIVVTVLQRGSCYAYLPLTTAALGTEYQVITWNASSWLSITSERHAVIRLTFPGGNCNIRSGNLTYFCGDDFTLHLYPPSTAVFTSTSDLSATHIQSSAPVFVIAGNTNTTTINDGDLADSLASELLPVFAWGRTFAVAPVPNNDGFGYSLKIGSGRHTAQVTIFTNSSENYTVPPGRIITVDIIDNHPAYVEANVPVQVMQFVSSANTGDNSSGAPASLSIPARERYTKSYTFALVSSFRNYVAIVIEGNATAELRLNNQLTSSGGWRPIPGSTMVTRAFEVTAGGFGSVSHPTENFGAFRFSHIVNDTTYGTCEFAYPAGALFPTTQVSSTSAGTSLPTTATIPPSRTQTTETQTTGLPPANQNLFVRDCSCLNVSSELQPSYNGFYYTLNQTVNGQPVYKRQDCDIYLFLYLGIASYWVFGPSLGNNRGMLLNSGIFQHPEEARRWEGYNSTIAEFTEDLRFIPSCSCPATSCKSVEFVRSGESSVFDGVFVFNETTFNGRPVFKHEDRNLYLFYQVTGTCQRWVVGASVGSQTAVLYANDRSLDVGAIPPSTVWRYFKGGASGFVDEPDIDLRCYRVSSGVSS